MVEGDDPEQYDTEPITINGRQIFVLRRQPNGDCIYLDGGCTIHDRAPTVCRVYDCAAAYRMWGHHEAKQRMPRKILKRARKLLKSGYEPGNIIARSA